MYLQSLTEKHTDTIRTLYFDDSILARFFGQSSTHNDIPGELYSKYNVKKGLRNEDGTGVLVGLTKVSDVVGYVKDKDGKVTPCDGDLLYRGYSIHDLIKNRRDNYGFEETCFLLLFGFLPNKNQIANFKGCLADRYSLPDNFLINEILGSPSLNLMNRLQALTLQLYNYDDDPDNTDVYETLRKGLNLIAKLPVLACYAYQSKLHKVYHDSLIMHYPRQDYSIAENILLMLRPDGKFTSKEANLLDALLVIHADHGGGNNSTFTDVVVGSTGTDLYSAICASLGALKGPRHGGANISVSKMMEEVKAITGMNCDKAKIKKVILDILDGKLYDHSGLLYGFGHAVYTLSDPRAEILRELCRNLAQEKGMLSTFNFYKMFEDTAHEVLMEKKKKPLPTNVDFYSGLAYSMLGIPDELFTPLFAIARVSGWVSHNMENKMYDGRIMRPATKYVGEMHDFVDMDSRS